ncbi:hypothetical protein AURDEDRAFT_177613 [Auricularia subglabra TFB-10046 SS5]|uniref:Uncharacterized protein n=1 Tax=Auricularia subglabra (strain TFB-10046 / SS5) TaxID=717982 RepID=J0CSP8_AURST|nr:hypothetical protein AURDEDRAFT_177613 [Auricularia subglabra TFB-10046 SS5]
MRATRTLAWPPSRLRRPAPSRGHRATPATRMLALAQLPSRVHRAGCARVARRLVFGADETLAVSSSPVMGRSDGVKPGSDWRFPTLVFAARRLVATARDARRAATRAVSYSPPGRPLVATARDARASPAVSSSPLTRPPVATARNARSPAVLSPSDGVKPGSDWRFPTLVFAARRLVATARDARRAATRAVSYSPPGRPLVATARDARASPAVSSSPLTRPPVATARNARSPAVLSPVQTRDRPPGRPPSRGHRTEHASRGTHPRSPFRGHHPCAISSSGDGTRLRGRVRRLVFNALPPSGVL